MDHSFHTCHTFFCFIHLLIAKTERDGRTYTEVTPLDREGRKKEIARIIGGAVITETTLASAEEMLGEAAHG